MIDIPLKLLEERTTDKAAGFLAMMAMLTDSDHDALLRQAPCPEQFFDGQPTIRDMLKFHRAIAAFVVERINEKLKDEQ